MIFIKYIIIQKYFLYYWNKCDKRGYSLNEFQYLLTLIHKIPAWLNKTYFRIFIGTADVRFNKNIETFYEKYEYLPDKKFSQFNKQKEIEFL